MSGQTIIRRAAEILRIEADGLLSVIERLDESFVQAVEIIRHCKGKVVVTGVGKSGLICAKIAATLSSTGTPAFFLHSGDALHGDLGIVMPDDVVVAISNSGETDEILKLLPHFKHHSLKLIVITGNPESTLAKAGEVVLDVSVKQEACPLGLAPTTSTTVTLAMGDALAVVLLEQNGFNETDFAMRHPGGMLGRKLLLRVEDLMYRGERLPLVQEMTTVKEALFEITAKRLGVTGVVNDLQQLVGVLTDGDLRRGLESKGQILSLAARDLMTRNPKTIPGETLASEAVAVMEQFPITSLFVLEHETKKPVGIVHLHDLIKVGL
ncbi:MAG TPA: KpsF/GutQ family sugar-phosphate isomerase [Candidatus Limnocylindrales bacterium]|nr:KpsF/GutQ family sugar-phosphate isomerase [Candidatus Limnocylindrales bacterium]